MDLLKAVQNDSLKKIKALVLSNGIPVNSKWLDYAILNEALERGRMDVANFLIDEGCRVEKTAVSIASTTPLHHAVKLDDIQLVTKLLEKRASITAVNANGDTPLHFAFMTNRNYDIIDLMLSHIKRTEYVNPSRNEQGFSHMHIACIRNNVEVVQYFIDNGINIDISVYKISSMWPGYTPLHFAIDFRSLDVIKILKANGANMFVSDKNKVKAHKLARKNFTNAAMIDYFLWDQQREEMYSHGALSNFHVACMRNDSSIVESFLENGAAVNNRIHSSSVFCPLYTPLHFAVESNCEKNVKLLLNHGADVEFKNKDHMTPLHLALYNDRNSQRCRIVDLLYAALKNIDQVCADLYGLTYFHIACTRNDIEVVKQHLDRGAHVNAQILFNLKNFAHCTPLHFAVQYRCKEVVDELIKRGANVNSSDNGRRGTPLHVAFERGNTEIVEMLLKNGARASMIRPNDNKTMLHLFVDEVMNFSNYPHSEFYGKTLSPKGQDEIDTYITKLIELGCDIDAKDSDGNTALHLACSDPHRGIICTRALLERGANINIENNDQDTPFTKMHIGRGNSDICIEVYHHVQKLNVLGMKVNPKNEESCAKLLSKLEEYDPDADYFELGLTRERQQRLKEIAKMKSAKIDNRVTLYNALLEKKAGKLAAYSKSEAFKNILEATDFRKEYPSYGFMLKLQFQKGLDIAEVNEASKKIVAAEPPREPRAKRRKVAMKR